MVVFECELAFAIGLVSFEGSPPSEARMVLLLERGAPFGAKEIALQ